MAVARGWRRWLVHLLSGTLAALGLVLLAPPAPAQAICTGASYYGGLHYCPANAIGVQQTKYGTGRRVWLDNVRVTAVGTSTVTVAQFVPCPPRSFCGARGYNGYNYLTLPWRTSRPAVGDVVRLYGTTTTGNLTPAGYVKIGTFDPTCMDPLGCCTDWC